MGASLELLCLESERLPQNGAFRDLLDSFSVVFPDCHLRDY
jgi:hypothetical protein